jgi:carbon storage regulator CsrA
MLVLTRRSGELVVLTLADGSTVAVEVLSIRRGKDGERVRLGLTAPADVRIDRAEVHALRGQADAAELRHIAQVLERIDPGGGK